MADELEKNLKDEGFLKRLYADLDALDAEAGSGAETVSAAAGAGLGAAASFAALYGLGTAGLSAAGITSGLAAAGALIGGGMVAGIGVLAAPVAVLGVAGFAAVTYRKRKRIRQLQRDVLAKAVSKQSAILERLERSADLSEQAVQELRDRNAVLAEIIRRLQTQAA